MNRLKYITALLVFLQLSFVAKGQSEMCDTIVPERVVVKCASIGITYMNNLDTYLSGYNHTGKGLYFSNENFRDACTCNYHWKYQTFLTANLGTTTLHDDTQLSGMVNYNWSGYHPFEINSRLQLLAGVQIQLSGGALYIPTNGNNLVSVKLRTAFAATGMAVWHIPSRRGDYVLRGQVDVPLAGIMFAPEFGQSYYEIFGLEQYKETIAFSHPVNSPSVRGIFSADIPVSLWRKTITFRLSYIADIYQSDVNEIRTHLYNHAFTIGLVRTIYKVKSNDRIKQYSPF